jgi:hypothetical protein
MFALSQGTKDRCEPVARLRSVIDLSEGEQIRQKFVRLVSPIIGTFNESLVESVRIRAFKICTSAKNECAPNQ